MAAELQRALRDVRETLLSNPVTPRVDDPADINRHHCRYVAETVADRLDDDVDVLEDGGRGFAHTWIAYEGRHYDAECVHGVSDYRDLPFFERHPEAAVQVEDGAGTHATLRHRGTAPLYPTALAPDRPAGLDRAPSDRRYALLGVLLGLVAYLVGLGGVWALHRHLVVQAAVLQVLFVDLKIVGVLAVVVAPLLFFVLRPAYRGRSASRR